MRATQEEEQAPTDEFDGFFRSFFPLVARTVALIVHDFETGQDIAQESLARVYARWERIGSLEHARNLVFRVAINLARSHLRRQRRALAAGSGGLGESSAEEAATVADRVTLAGALSELSGRQRTCLALVDYAGLDVGDVARFLWMRPSTVRVHLTRGRRALAKALEPTYQERANDD